MSCSTSARQRFATTSGSVCLLLLAASLTLAAPSTRAAGSDPTPPASTLGACERIPSTPTPFKTDADGLSWEPLLEALPAVVNPSAEERAYLVAVDEVHRHVRLDGSRVGMAMIMYSICEIDGLALGSRLAAIRTDLDQAAAVLDHLAVPDRFGALHRNYLQIVHLYQQGLAEMDLTGRDGNIQHLRDAFPFTKAASDELAELEELVWAAPVLDVGQPTNADGPSLSAATAGPQDAVIDLQDAPEAATQPGRSSRHW